MAKSDALLKARTPSFSQKKYIISPIKIKLTENLRNLIKLNGDVDFYLKINILRMHGCLLVSIWWKQNAYASQNKYFIAKCTYSLNSSAWMDLSAHLHCLGVHGRFIKGKIVHILSTILLAPWRFVRKHPLLVLDARCHCIYLKKPVADTLKFVTDWLGLAFSSLRLQLKWDKDLLPYIAYVC